MRFTKTVLTAGFAMFSMFLGSGNLVFPLIIGTDTLSNAPLATLGLVCTGVIVPFLGLLGVILYAGNRRNFFSCIGKIPAFVLTFAMLAVMGPLGVIPRCIVVAYGGVSLFIEGIPLWLFSLVFCALTLILVWNHNRVIPILGRILTPWLLLGLALVIGAGLLLSPAPPEATIQGWDAFKRGFVEGYQTMDLLAAFFFSATTVAYLRAHLRSEDSPKTLLKISLASSFIGAGLLASVYIGFVLIGAKNAPYLNGIHPEQMLAGIAGQTLGAYAIPVAGISIAIACLTTATILTMLFADFLREDLMRNVFRKRLGNHPAVMTTLGLGFFVSLVGFGTLRAWIGSIVVVAYPALIALAIANILNKIWGRNLGAFAFWITFVISLIYSILG